MQSRLTISTGVTAAPVDFLLTVGAHVSKRTAARVATSSLLHAGSTIEAGSIGTGHGADLAVLAVEALWARTGVIVLLVLGKKSKNH